MFYKLNEDKTVSRVDNVRMLVYGGPNIVAKTRCGPNEVSTVFIPISGDYWHFETMIFTSTDDEWQWRYATWGEAVAGHAKAVKNLLDNKLHSE